MAEKQKRTRTHTNRTRFDRLQSQAIRSLRRERGLEPLPDQRLALMAVLDSLIRFRDQQKQEREKTENILKTRRKHLQAMRAYHAPK